jgi:hypothetical protein
LILTKMEGLKPREKTVLSQNMNLRIWPYKATPKTPGVGVGVDSAAATNKLLSSLL